MVGFITRFLLTALLIAICLSPAATQDNDEPVRTSVPPQESKSKLVVLQEKLKSLREEKKEFYRARQQWKHEKEDINNQIKSLQRNIKRDSEKIEPVKEKNKQLLDKLEQVKSRINSHEIDIGMLAAILQMQNNVLETFIKQSIPWQNEARLSQVESFNPDKDKPSDALRGIWDIFSRESALTRLCEADTLKQNDKNLRAVRIGSLFVLYQSEDLKESGILFKDIQGKLIKHPLVNQSSQDIKNAFLILKKKKPPALVTLPLLMSVFKKKYPSEDINKKDEEKRDGKQRDEEQKDDEKKDNEQKDGEKKDEQKKTD